MLFCLYHHCSIPRVRSVCKGGLLWSKHERVEEKAKGVVVLDVKDSRDVLVGPDDNDSALWRDAEVVVDVVAALVVAVVVRPDLVVVFTMEYINLNSFGSTKVRVSMPTDIAVLSLCRPQTVREGVRLDGHAGVADDGEDLSIMLV
jgi:hypothetical protein